MQLANHNNRPFRQEALQRVLPRRTSKVLHLRSKRKALLMRRSDVLLAISPYTPQTILLGAILNTQARGILYIQPSLVLKSQPFVLQDTRRCKRQQSIYKSIQQRHQRTEARRSRDRHGQVSSHSCFVLINRPR